MQLKQLINYYYQVLNYTSLDHISQLIHRNYFTSLQLATKEVIRSYSTYVNNFTAAIYVLEQGLKKKVKFIAFLKEKYKQSNTSLSLQGLLLKPIQRFPQYILFIQVHLCEYYS